MYILVNFPFSELIIANGIFLHLFPSTCSCITTFYMQFLSLFAPLIFPPISVPYNPLTSFFFSLLLSNYKVTPFTSTHLSTPRIFTVYHYHFYHFVSVFQYSDTQIFQSDSCLHLILRSDNIIKSYEYLFHVFL